MSEIFMSEKITLIIPTLNASNTLDATLKSASKFFKNIIVVDAYSKDNTVKIAKKYKSKILLCSANRGKQLHRGAQKANSDWFLFLHADTIINKNSYKEILNFIKIENNINKAAYFKLKFNDKNYSSLFVEKIVYLRNIIFKLPYGDQGLLISKNFYKKIGGYKELPIMEDVNIIKRIKYKNLIIINSYIITDAVKYKKQGWIIRPLINLTCLTLYFMGCNINKINNIYKK